MNTLIWRCAVVLFLLGGGYSIRADCVPFPDGLVGFWTGDGNANDLVGSNHGVLVNGATANGAGMVGSAFSFDGINDFVQITDAAALKPTNLTIEAWVRLDAFGSTFNSIGEQYVVFKKNTRGGSFEGYALQEATNSVGQHVFHFVVIGAGGPPSATVNSTSALSTGVWYHVAGVRGSNYLQLYLNGVLEAQTSVTFAQDYGSTPLYFGATGQAYDGKFRGRLDEVSLYNRALSFNEIANIYAAGAAGKCRLAADNFVNRAPIYGLANTVTGSNTNATKEFGEPNHAGSAGGHSIWWTWTAPTNGTVTIDTTGSSFDTLLAVYTGTSVSNLTGVTSNDDSGDSRTSWLKFEATQNTTYQIAVDGYDGDSGSIILRLRQSVIPPQIVVQPQSQVTITNGTVQFNVTATGSLPLRYQWFKSGFGIPSATNVSFIITNLQLADGGYYCVVVSNTAAGVVSSNAILTVVPTPMNDQFSNRIALAGVTVAIPGYNVGASHEAGEYDHAYAGTEGSVWWRWTAPGTGMVTVDTVGSSFRTALAVYTGNVVSNLTRVADDFASGTNLACQVSFQAMASNIYQIVVDGVSGASGSNVLNIQQSALPPPPNDYFTNRFVLNDLTNTATGSNVNATHEAGEYNHAFEEGDKSVWWSWTAPTNGTVTVDTLGSSFATVLAVYTNNSIPNLVGVAYDVDGGSNNTSLLTFEAVPFTPYQIAVDGNSGASGNIVLHLRLSALPPQFTLQPHSQKVGVGAYVNFSSEAIGSQTLSYQWHKENVPIPGATNSSYDIVDAQFPDSGNYSVMVSNFAGTATSSNAVLAVVASPANDNFADAIVISGISNYIAGSNEGATHESVDGNPPPQYDQSYVDPGNASVWWAYFATNDGTVEIVNNGSAFPLVMIVYQGDLVNGLNVVAHNYQRVGFPPYNYNRWLRRIRFDVRAGETYFIAVDGYGQTQGDFSLTVLFTAAPGNNDFAFRFPVNSTNQSSTGFNTGADLEPPDEPEHSGPYAGRSVWWAWTPARSGPVILTTFGSSFDTILDVYTGLELADLSLVASNNDSYAFPWQNGRTNDVVSRLRFNAQAGTNYHVAVAGVDGEAGSVSLNFVSLAIEDILTLVRTVKPDRSADFTAKLRLSNLRTNVTGALRLRLIARAGFSCVKYLGQDLEFRDGLKAADQDLGIIDLPGNGNMATGNSLTVMATGTCPPPYEDDSKFWGMGWGIIAILEEQIGGTWQAQDARLIVTGDWPAVGTSIGPGGGVVLINASYSSDGPRPGIVQVHLGPPAAIRAGGAWRVSPTNYGNLFYRTNYTTQALNLLVQSTNIGIEVKELPGFITPTSPPITVVEGTNVPLELNYSMYPPRLKYERSTGIGFTTTGAVDTVYSIDFAPQLSSSNWATLRKVTNKPFLGGTNWLWISNSTPIATTNRFFRARWLSE